MEVNWSIIAESSAIDSDTNNLSLFNIIEQVQIPEPPERPESSDSDALHAVPLRFVVVILFSRSEPDRGEKKEARLVVAMPNGSVAETSLRFDVDLESATRNRTRINIGTLPLAGQGEYCFRIEGLDEDGEWQMMSEAPLLVEYLGD